MLDLPLHVTIIVALVGGAVGARMYDGKVADRLRPMVKELQNEQHADIVADLTDVIVELLHKGEGLIEANQDSDDPANQDAPLEERVAQAMNVAMAQGDLEAIKEIIADPPDYRGRFTSMRAQFRDASNALLGAAAAQGAMAAAHAEVIGQYVVALATIILWVIFGGALAMAWISFKTGTACLDTIEGPYDELALDITNQA